MKFSKEFLMDELDLPYSALEDRVVDNSRWAINHTIIWKHPDGRHFRCSYAVGATESQSERPWEYEEEVDCTEVERKQVTREEWVPKSEVPGGDSHGL